MIGVLAPTMIHYLRQLLFGALDDGGSNEGAPGLLRALLQGIGAVAARCSAVMIVIENGAVGRHGAPERIGGPRAGTEG